MNGSRLAAWLRRVVKAPWLKQTLLAVPRIALLVPKLMSDDRVPKRTKLALGGLAVYLASPWDLIPDFIPGLGQLDGAIILLLFVDGVLNQVDDAVIWGALDGRGRDLAAYAGLFSHRLTMDTKGTQDVSVWSGGCGWRETHRSNAEGW